MASLTQLLFLLCGCCAMLVRGHGPFQHPKSAFPVHKVEVDIDASVSMTVSISELTENNQRVVVTWSGVREPSPEDLIALYVPASANPKQSVPVQYINASATDSAYLDTGEGSASFTLHNMRWSMGFKLIKGGYVKPRLVAQAPAIWNSIAFAPTGGHLALHEDMQSVVVQWVSASRTPQQVQWGEAQAAAASGAAAAPYKHTAPSRPKSYNATDMCGYPANSVGWMWPGHIHTAVIPSSSLTPGRRMYYRYGSEEGGWSEERTFIAPPPLGVQAQQPRAAAAAQAARSGSGSSSSSCKHAAASSSKDGFRRLAGHAGSAGSVAAGPAGACEDDGPAIKFLAFNDVSMQYPLLFNDPWAGGLHFAATYGENSTKLSTHLAEGHEADAHLALLVGDLAYALGFAADWDVFGQQFEPAFTQWPMAVGTGNHERDWPDTGDAFEGAARDSGGECNVPFMHRWYTPANARGDPRTSYYSFSMGPVHFLVLDSESPSGPDSPQGRFVAADLAAVDRSRFPWLVVGMHRMMVAPATWRRRNVGDIDNMERLQEDYEELFMQYGVDVVIQGHEHAYARTCPWYKGDCYSRSGDDDSSSRAAGGNWLQQGQELLWRGVAGLRSFFGAQLAFVQQHHQQQQQRQGRGRGDTGCGASSCLRSPGAPVYVLAGHAGAGFTHSFPDPLPDWVEYGAEGRNGYLRFTASAGRLRMEAVSTDDDGGIMDSFELQR